MKINLTQAAAFSCAEVFKYTDNLIKNNPLWKETPDARGNGRDNAVQRSNALSINGNHYGVLGYLSSLMTGATIVEMGTRFGFSALAMSINETNTVTSYDIIERGQSMIVRPNLTFKLLNLLEEENSHLMLENDLLFVDIAPHNGKDEKQITDYLIANDYKGITVWHDIYDGRQNNKTMWNWWNNLPDTVTKYDINRGTLNREQLPGLGLIDFSGAVEIIG